jgi:predicted nucleic acid-binding Zn ribbon protein
MVPQPSVCPRCAADWPETARFCSHCGAAAGEPPDRLTPGLAAVAILLGAVGSYFAYAGVDALKGPHEYMGGIPLILTVAVYWLVAGAFFDGVARVLQPELHATGKAVGSGDSRRCSLCGTPLPNVEPFCPDCGARVDEPSRARFALIVLSAAARAIRVMALGAVGAFLVLWGPSAFAMGGGLAALTLCWLLAAAAFWGLAKELGWGK